jgi:hypothetical protein
MNKRTFDEAKNELKAALNIHTHGAIAKGFQFKVDPDRSIPTERPETIGDLQIKVYQLALAYKKAFDEDLDSIDGASTENIAARDDLFDAIEALELSAEKESPNE